MKMDKVTKIPITDRILDLTLEIIYLLTGEDYTVVKKTSSHHLSSCNCPHGSQGWSGNLTKTPPRTLRLEKTSKKILEVTNEMIELLTGEVPIRCQDVSVYFSMEEWEYLEGHKDLYKDIVMMEDQPPLTSPDGSNINKHLGRSVNPVISQNSTKEYLKIPHGFTDDVIAVKVEVKEEAEEPYIIGNVWCKEKEIFPGVELANRTFKKEENSLESQMGVPERSENLNMVNNRLMMPGINSVETKFEYSSLNGEEDFESEDDTKQLHNVGDRFTCQDCGKHFRYKAHLTVHQRVHTGERPYKCPECEKCFATSSQLTSHKTSHSEEKRYECSECSKRFRWKSLLVVHERRHRGEKPFECRQCGKAFAGKSNLLTHERSHIGEKPFTCSECGKCFVAKHTLSRHMVIHTGEKPFICPECGRRFKLKQTLCSHLRTHTRTHPSIGTDYQSPRVNPCWRGSLEEPQVWTKYVIGQSQLH